MTALNPMTSGAKELRQGVEGKQRTNREEMGCSLGLSLDGTLIATMQVDATEIPPCRNIH